MRNSFVSLVVSVALKSTNTLPGIFFCSTDTSATSDATFKDVQTKVGMSSPRVDSRRIDVGKIGGLSRRLLLMV